MKRIAKTMDGNQAAAYVSYAYSDVAAIYPITPSSTMAEVTDEWAVEGRKNIFNQTVRVTQMQSEAGAAGAVHGSLATGALTTTFTASQGLLLMIPNLYKIAGEQLPGVFNVAARAIASHALSIFGDHSDIYACRQCGVGMIAAGSVQEVMDLTPISHLASLRGKVPFINFFDGFRTSHEIQKIQAWDYETLKGFMNEEDVYNFRKKALNPNSARSMGSAQNPDIFFQAREASNTTYDTLPQVVLEEMEKINKAIGSDYGLFNYYGAKDATHVIVAMGSVCETIEETIDYLNKMGEKVGLIKVRLYRPFSVEHFIKEIPESATQISVLDRTKEPGSIGEPLYLDVVAALKHSNRFNIKVCSGRYGLGSKDTIPDHIKAVYDNSEKEKFTIGIVDDVTNLSLPIKESINTENEDVVTAKFWGLGSDGTVGANKNSIKIIGDHTDKSVQAYFDYDSKKSGGLTVSHLRFSDHKVRSTYLIKDASFVACHHQSYVYQYDLVGDLKKGGTFLLNTTWNEQEVEENLPANMKKELAEKEISFYVINATKLGKEVGLNGKVNTILQSAFFALANVIPAEEAIKQMKEAAKKSYQKKGDKIVQMNYEAIEVGAKNIVKIEVKDSWKDESIQAIEQKSIEGREEVQKFVTNIQVQINQKKGDKLPVSAFMDYVDGHTPAGTSAYERRKIAVDVPVWKKENCIQCNRCSFVCPHAVIRPVVLNEEEVNSMPKDMDILPMNGIEELSYSIVISNVDCTGCAACSKACPGKAGNKALEMKSVSEFENNELDQLQLEFDEAKKISVKKESIEKFKELSVKGSQFKKPLLEFSGACAGCGETPYAKLVTQLFGDKMYIANATGCSSIWGNSSPSTPYTADECGKGPAWSNSLFEDAAEFGYGMLLAQESIRDRLKDDLISLKESNEDLKVEIDKWVDTFKNGALNSTATDELVCALEKNASEEAKKILEEKDFLNKKSQWIFGGDGWAYDIGFGGLDHVIASGKDINILVFDTEMYSNTGGQSSKSTPLGSVAKFAAGGKQVQKKDLAGIAMSYGNVYVAQIAMGADYNQCIKAISEAESYNGPSIIIAYSPCISHGIKIGMSCAQMEEEKAVKSGYFHLFRYNPNLLLENKNPFSLDSKEPVLDFKEFLDGEVRYSSLEKAKPEEAKVLFDEAKRQARRKYLHLKRLVDLYNEE
ncbi:MAG: pyruvate:ferredoxin (flavodoxin) oxidoreductase [Lachnospiraceae bacterium]